MILKKVQLFSSFFSCRLKTGFLFSILNWSLLASICLSSTFPPVVDGCGQIVLVYNHSLISRLPFVVKTSGHSYFNFLTSYYLLNQLQPVDQNLHLALPIDQFSNFISQSSSSVWVIIFLLTCFCFWYSTMLICLLLQLPLLHFFCLLLFFFLVSTC